MRLPLCAAGSAAGSSEQTEPVGEFADADKHEPDDALLQQPHDVLPDQHEASAGHKPKTDRQPVQPRWTITVRSLKNFFLNCLLFYAADMVFTSQTISPAECFSTRQCRPRFQLAASLPSPLSATWASPKLCEQPRCNTRFIYWAYRVILSELLTGLLTDTAWSSRSPLSPCNRSTATPCSCPPPFSPPP